MMIKVIQVMMERFPDAVDSLYDDKGSYFWTAAKADEKYCTPLAPGRYVWTSMDNRSKIRCLRYLFEKCDIPQTELVFLLEFTKQES